MTAATHHSLALRFSAVLTAVPIASLLCISTVRSAPPDPDASVTLRDVNVVDVESGSIREHQDVTVTSGTITAVQGSSSRVSGTPEDVVGAYVIPGLWDMHVHLAVAGPESLPLFVANGVLGVRDMGTDLAVLGKWLRVHQVAPRVIGAGAVIESPTFLAHVDKIDRIVVDRGIEPLNFQPPIRRLSVGSPEQVAGALDDVVAAGGTFVKARTYESPTIFLTIAREARRRGLPFAGHPPPDGVSWEDAVSAGMTSIEHLGGSYAAQLGGMARDRRQRVYARMIRAGAMVDPNVVCDVIRRMPDHRATKMVSAATAGPMSYNPWLTAPLRDVFRRELAIRVLEKQVEPPPDWGSITRQEFLLLKELALAGVPVLAGTDLGSLLVYPGFSLHDELQVLVEDVGLTPAEALRSATSAPARFFHASDWGHVAPGQRADLVLLDGNPLKEITNTRLIRGVVLGGRYYDRLALKALLPQATAH